LAERPALRYQGKGFTIINHSVVQRTLYLQKQDKFKSLRAAYKTALSEFYAARKVQETKARIQRESAIQAASRGAEAGVYVGKHTTRNFAAIEG
jgi:Mitochondrial ribosomal protein S25